MKYLFLSFFSPLLVSLLLALPWRLKERTVVWLSTLGLMLPTLATLYLIFEAVFHAKLGYEQWLASITVSGHQFPIIAWVDHQSLVLLALTHFLGFLVLKFSHGYLHIEKGYQRFFSAILFFIFGHDLLSLAGNLDIFFAGWEIVGFSSFFLIAFYRSHTRSVLNAWRIYNLYRICDVGLLLGAVVGHIMWNEATRFSELSHWELGARFSTTPHLGALGFLILFAALGKSAQFPFHNWPSRAMEGPTPSSAIFYGALSIHAGVFLLLRTQPLWMSTSMVRATVFAVGVLTMFTASIQGRIQANIKGQIAYASVAQIGLMFVELSLGLSNWVLIHLVLHACYRCFQILVSPAVVASSSSLNNRVIVQRIGQRRNWMDRLPKTFNRTLYLLGMNEFGLDISWRGFSFLPWKKIYWLSRTFVRWFYVFLALAISLIALFGWLLGYGLSFILALMLAFEATAFAIRALVFQPKPFQSMVDLSFTFVGCMLSVYFLDHHLDHSIEAYALPVLMALVPTLVICWRFRDYDLRNFHALGSAHPIAANVFLICFMVLAGLPVSTAFVGEDMLIEGVLKTSLWHGVFVTGCIMVNGLVLVKIYTRLFMGRPKVPDRNSSFEPINR